jgi:hypothetical protein
MSMSRTLRGKVAVVGVGETDYYKAGQSPDAEFKLTLMAILHACEDAGIAPQDIDGFASYSKAGVVPVLWQTLRQPLPREWPSVWWCFVAWRRVSSADSVRARSAMP